MKRWDHFKDVEKIKFSEKPPKCSPDDPIPRHVIFLMIKKCLQIFYVGSRCLKKSECKGFTFLKFIIFLEKISKFD
jgi:hypothetical protein